MRREMLAENSSPDLRLGHFICPLANYSDCRHTDNDLIRYTPHSTHCLRPAKSNGTFQMMNNYIHTVWSIQLVTSWIGMSKITLKILIQTLSVDVLGDICWSYGPPFGRFLFLHAMALPLNVLTMSELGTLNTCLYSPKIQRHFSMMINFTPWRSNL